MKHALPNYPQHPLSEHPHVGSPPVNQPMIIAAAQPTPAFTLIAPAGQFNAHAPHSMHKSFPKIRALRPSISNTRCGHTSAHLPHPAHFSSANFNVATFFK